MLGSREGGRWHINDRDGHVLGVLVGAVFELILDKVSGSAKLGLRRLQLGALQAVLRIGEQVLCYACVGFSLRCVYFAAKNLVASLRECFASLGREGPNKGPRQRSLLGSREGGRWHINH